MGVLHVHGLVTATGGDLISIEVRGLSTTSPDGHQVIKGTITYQTGSKEYAWLNSTLGIVDGITDLGKMEMNAKVFRH